MSDKDDRAFRLRDDEPGRGDVVGKRYRRVLHDAHVVAVLLQELVDALPAGAVDKTAMDEHDGGRC